MSAPRFTASEYPNGLRCDECGEEFIEGQPIAEVPEGNDDARRRVPGDLRVAVVRAMRPGEDRSLMARYRKRPVVIEAEGPIAETRLIDTLEGTMRADVGDYIITGVKGETYPCKPDIFEATYEPVED